MGQSQPKEGLKARHRGAATVVAEDELVEVGLHVLGRDAAMGAVHPCLQVRDRAVHAREKLLFAAHARDLAWTMLVAESHEAVVGREPVGVDESHPEPSSPS